MVAQFVDAADRLVNLLRESQEGWSPTRIALHQQTIEEAMNAYDLARRSLTGEDVSSA